MLETSLIIEQNKSIEPYHVPPEHEMNNLKRYFCTDSSDIELEEKLYCADHVDTASWHRTQLDGQIRGFVSFLKMPQTGLTIALFCGVAVSRDTQFPVFEVYACSTTKPNEIDPNLKIVGYQTDFVTVENLESLRREKNNSPQNESSKFEYERAKTGEFLTSFYNYLGTNVSS